MYYARDGVPDAYKYRTDSREAVQAMWVRGNAGPAVTPCTPPVNRLAFRPQYNRLHLPVVQHAR
jgi:hypothetical protein